MKVNWICYIIGWIEGGYKEIILLSWYRTGIYSINYTFIIEEFIREMEILICSICLFIINYSYSYMGRELILWYIIRILLFKCGMELIVRSKESILLFIGWELIGWMSYMLINYWSGRIESNKGSLEGIIMNKIGDIFIIYNLSNMNSTLGWKYLIGDIKSSTWFLLIGAMIKSAQFGLQSWLTKSMAGPTPVSALIHSSTLVTAGVLLLFRCESMNTNIGLLRLIGSGTLIYSFLNSFRAYDFKKLIAWSTSNQMGILILSLGENLNMMDHIITHGISKSLWFLSIGKIIERQDIRRRGGERDISSLIYRMIGSINICGIGFSSGTLTKESILENISSYLIIWSIILSSIGTIEYTLRSFNINKGGYHKENIGYDIEIEELLKASYVIDWLLYNGTEILFSSLMSIIGISIDEREIIRDGYEMLKRDIIDWYNIRGSNIRRFISNGIEENIWIIRRFVNISKHTSIGGSYSKFTRGILIWV